MPLPVFADVAAAVKNLSDRIAHELLAAVENVDASVAQAKVEQAVVGMVFNWGREALGLMWSEQCRQATADDIAERDLDDCDVTLRGEAESRWRVMSTLGPVGVASFAYRDRSVGVGSVTRVPARTSSRANAVAARWSCACGGNVAWGRSRSSVMRNAR